MQSTWRRSQSAQHVRREQWDRARHRDRARDVPQSASSRRGGGAIGDARSSRGSAPEVSKSHLTRGTRAKDDASEIRRTTSINIPVADRTANTPGCSATRLRSRWNRRNRRGARVGDFDRARRSRSCRRTPAATRRPLDRQDGADIVALNLSTQHSAIPGE